MSRSKTAVMARVTEQPPANHRPAPAPIIHMDRRAGVGDARVGYVKYTGASEMSSDKPSAAADRYVEPADPRRAGGAPLGDRVAAVLILLALSPVLLVLAAAVALTIGRPVFYRGARLGKDRAPYMVYKFRTLPTDIQGRLGTHLFSEREEVLPVVARFLRESRLDELPQLLNVARGEMRLFGPRPERPEIYERYGRGHPDYELRFRSAPGIFGVSQLVTPHSSPKRLRARLDRRAITANRRASPMFMLRAAASLLRQLLVAGGRYLWKNAVVLKLAKAKRDQRSQLRVLPRQAAIELIDPTHRTGAITGRILDMNRSYIRARFDRPLPWSFVTTHRSRVSIRRGRGDQGRTKTARCHAHVESLLSDAHVQEGVEYLIAYSPDTALNRYLVDQYFLGQAIVARR